MADGKNPSTNKTPEKSTSFETPEPSNRKPCWKGTLAKSNRFNWFSNQRSSMIKAQKSPSPLLFWIVILLLVLYMVLDVVAQMLPPHFSPISQSESALAVGKFGYIMTANFLVRGVLSLLFIFAFLQTLGLAGVARGQFRTGTYLLSVWLSERFFLQYSQPTFLQPPYRGMEQFILSLPSSHLPGAHSGHLPSRSR
jgi:hypothetical protein